MIQAALRDLVRVPKGAVLFPLLEGRRLPSAWLWRGCLPRRHVGTVYNLWHSEAVLPFPRLSGLVDLSQVLWYYPVHFLMAWLLECCV